MPAKIKYIYIVSLILLLLISQVVLGLMGGVQIQTPCTTNNKYNHHYTSKDIHASYHKGYEANNTQLEMMDGNDYMQINIPTNSLHTPFEELQSVNVGTFANDYLPFRRYNNSAKYKSFGQSIGRTDDAVIQTFSFYKPLAKTQFLYTNVKHNTLGTPIDYTTNDVIIGASSLRTPFEDSQIAHIRAKRNAFGPPMEGMPIGDSILPLLLFSFIYIVARCKSQII